MKPKWQHTTEREQLERLRQARTPTQREQLERELHAEHARRLGLPKDARSGGLR